MELEAKIRKWNYQKKFPTSTYIIYVSLSSSCRKSIIKKYNTNGVLQQLYKELYTSDVNPQRDELTDSFTNVNMPKLSTEQIEWPDSPITETDIRKAPGMDWFPVEYYKQYIDILAPILKGVYNEALTLGSLPLTFYEASISVIPKKKTGIRQTLRIIDIWV